MEAIEHQEIHSILAARNYINCYVTSDGQIFYVPPTDKKLNPATNLVIEQIGELLRDVGLEPTTKAVSQLEYQQLGCKQTVTHHAFEGADENELLKDIIAEGVKLKASDIHIFAWRDKGCIQYRSYGILGKKTPITRELGSRIFRLIGNQCPNQQFADYSANDGRFDIKIDQQTFTVRVNTVPSPRGSKIVIRLFNPQEHIAFEHLGYYPQQQAMIQHIHRAPSGVFVITGPTNSGKTMSVHALLSTVSDELAILSIEDPVESMLDNVHHVPLSMDRDSQAEVEQYTTGVLRSTVRQDPNILFMGEMRDRDSSGAVMSVALQGKRVYTTLHTGSIEEVKERMIDVGMEPKVFNRPNFLNGIINQILVPRLCPHCCHDQIDNEGAYFNDLFAGKARYRNPDGCTQCINGVNGQILIAEVMPVNADNFHYFRDDRYLDLTAYLREQGIYRKVDIAIDKIRQGQLDPQYLGITSHYTQQQVESCLIT